MNAKPFIQLVRALESASNVAMAEKAIKTFNATPGCGKTGLFNAMRETGFSFLPVKDVWHVGPIDGYVLEPTDATMLGVSDCGDNLCPRCTCDPCRCVEGAHESSIHE